jgi:microsomal dipeptidase-like Zn-dependent dipeptidase
MKAKVVALAAATALGAAVLAAPSWTESQRNPVLPGRSIPVGEEARRLHGSLLVADLHCDMLLWGRDPLARSTRGQVDVPRLEDGNVALEVFSAVTQSPRGLNTERNDERTFDMLRPLGILGRWPPRTWTSPRERALYQAERLREAAARSAGALSFIASRGDLDAFVARRAKNPRSVGGLLAIEGMHAAEDGLADVDRLIDAGYRMMGLAHFFDNRWAGSAHGIEKYGLTAEGRSLVDRLEERRVLIDLAHSSSATIRDVLAITHRPLVVSHTGVRGTCPGTRNLDDQQIRGVASTGGVVGIGFWDTAVCDPSPRGIARAIRYAVDTIGAEHVGLGSDFDGAVATPFDASGLAQLTQALLDEKLTPDQIGLVMGGNVARLLGEALPRS